MEIAAKFTRILAYGSPLLTVIVAAICRCSSGDVQLRIRRRAEVHAVHGVSMYAFLPGIIKALLATLTIFIGAAKASPSSTRSPVTWVPLVDPSSTFLYSVASSIDVFNIWILILTTIGYSCLTKVKRSTCYAVVFGWWIVNTLFWAGIAGAFS